MGYILCTSVWEQLLLCLLNMHKIYRRGQRSLDVWRPQTFIPGPWRGTPLPPFSLRNLFLTDNTPLPSSGNVKEYIEGLLWALKIMQISSHRPWSRGWLSWAKDKFQFGQNPKSHNSWKKSPPPWVGGGHRAMHRVICHQKGGNATQLSAPSGSFLKLLKYLF